MCNKCDYPSKKDTMKEMLYTQTLDLTLQLLKRTIHQFEYTTYI